ncbi:hypothetical protein FRB99_006734 [Tulasnella sp. 403]|nr:hypothetical protein FRB99_006734 [Tulasnella sp. 403]
MDAWDQRRVHPHNHPHSSRQFHYNVDPSILSALETRDPFYRTTPTQDPPSRLPYTRDQSPYPHDFLNSPPPPLFSPTKSNGHSSGTAQSTFSADDSVSNRSKASGGGGGKLFKRVIKELTGGVKEPLPDEVYVQKKDKPMVTYGRGGAGRNKKKKPAIAGEASKSTTSVNTASDDMRSLKTASSSAATRSGKVKGPVYDPYLKTMVGPRGVPIASPPAQPNPPLPTVPFTSDYTTRAVSPSPSNQTHSIIHGAPTESLLGHGSIHGHRTPYSGSSRTGGWDVESSINEIGSLWSGPSRSPHAPPSSFKYGNAVSYQGYPSPPPSEGRSPRIPRRTDAGLRHASNDSTIPLSFSKSNLDDRVPKPPSQRPELPPTPLPPLPTSQATPSPLQHPTTTDLATLQTLYATLLAQHALTSSAVQQPIIPPQLAGNLDSIFAAAAAYHQLANTLATAAAINGTQLAASNTSPPNATSDNLSSLQSSLASYSIAGAATGKSSPSLSPPPHHRHVQMEQMRKSTNSAPSSSHGRPSPPLLEPNGVTQTEAAFSAKSPGLMTPPLSESAVRRKPSREASIYNTPQLLASEVSFTSATPSPAPSNRTLPGSISQPPSGAVTAADGYGAGPSIQIRSTESKHSDENEHVHSPLLSSSVPSLTMSLASTSSLSPPAVGGSNLRASSSTSSFDVAANKSEEWLKRESSALSSAVSLPSIAGGITAEEEEALAQLERTLAELAQPSSHKQVASDIMERYPRVAEAKERVARVRAAAVAAGAGRRDTVEDIQETRRRMNMALPPLPPHPSRPPSNGENASQQPRYPSPLPRRPEPKVSIPLQAQAAPHGSRSPAGISPRRPLLSAVATSNPSFSERSSTPISPSPTLTDYNFPMPPTSTPGRAAVIGDRIDTALPLPYRSRSTQVGVRPPQRLVPMPPSKLGPR